MNLNNWRNWGTNILIRLGFVDQYAYAYQEQDYFIDNTEEEEDKVLAPTFYEFRIGKFFKDTLGKVAKGASNAAKNIFGSPAKKVITNTSTPYDDTHIRNQLAALSKQMTDWGTQQQAFEDAWGKELDERYETNLGNWQSAEDAAAKNTQLLEALQSSTNRTQDILAGQIGGLTGQFGDLSGQLGDFRGDLGTLSQTQAAQNQVFADQIQGMGTDFSSQLAGLSQDLGSGLAGNQAAFQNALGILKGDVTGQIGNVSADILGQLGEAKDQWGGDITKLSDKFSGLGDTLSGQGKDIVSIRDNLLQQGSSIGDLEAGIGKLGADYAALSDADKQQVNMLYDLAAQGKGVKGVKTSKGLTFTSPRGLGTSGLGRDSLTFGSLNLA
tara:strand:- start:92 stop:1240 length:1149 start_codon:yes stop_codon:yes gene_type:complete